MRDTRGSEIKSLLKKHYPNAKFSVRLDKYSMGESINVHTDLIVRERIEHEGGYHEYKYSNETVAKIREIESLLSSYKHIDRDEYSGEILSGGNTYLFVEPIN